MLRGVFFWMAFCLCLVPTWFLAEFAAQREQLLQEAYATEGIPMFVEPIESTPLPVRVGIQFGRRCPGESHDCDALHCADSSYPHARVSRLQ